MARNILSKVFIHRSLIKNSSDNLLMTTCKYSCFGPNFISPVVSKPKLANLHESGEVSKLAHVPIKSARSEETTSFFYDPVFEQFINYVMRKGRKQLARELMNESLYNVKRLQVQKYNREMDLEEKEKIELNPLTIFHKAVNNCKPILQLTPIKRGGATYQVPIPVTDRRAQFLAMNWLIEQGKTPPKTERFPIKLARELIQASLGEGKTVKRKQDLHRQCEANRAYAHYRWG